MSLRILVVTVMQIISEKVYASGFDTLKACSMGILLLLSHN